MAKKRILQNCKNVNGKVERALQIDFSLYVVFTAFDPDKICHLRKNGLYSKVDLLERGRCQNISS